MSQPSIEAYAARHPQYYDETIPPLLARVLREPGPRVVLEAGCGDGSLLLALARAGLFDGKRVLAVDLSAERIRHVRDLGLGIVPAVDDVETLATVAEPVDLVISTQVIEHVDDVKMIAAMARVTKPGALVYLSTVQKQWYGWYFYRNQGRWVIDPTHLREYRGDAELVDRLAAAGFELLEQHKQPLSYPLSDLALKLLGARDRNVYRHLWLRTLRRLRLPVPGYSNWELLARRR